MQMASLTKQDLRAQSKAQLLKIFSDKEDIYERQNKIIHDIEMSSEFKKAKVIVTYYPLVNEFDLSSMIISNPNKIWLLPRTIGKGRMLLFEVGELHELQDSKHGKIAPPTNAFYKADQVDMVIMPGLAFDKTGYRLGRGMAYYDRFLAKLNKKAMTLGVIPKELLLDVLPHEEHDRSVKKVLSL